MSGGPRRDSKDRCATDRRRSGRRIHSPIGRSARLRRSSQPVERRRAPLSPARSRPPATDPSSRPSRRERRSWRKRNSPDLRTGPKGAAPAGSRGASFRKAADSRKMRPRSESHSCSTRSFPNACLSTNRFESDSTSSTVFDTPPPSSGCAPLLAAHRAIPDTRRRSPRSAPACPCMRTYQNTRKYSQIISCCIFNHLVNLIKIIFDYLSWIYLD